jgi:hypothetical protein
MKKDKMAWACCTNGETRNAYKILDGNSKGKKLLGKLKYM